MKNASLYRKVALERVSSPEQLDQLMAIVSARLWIVLVAVVLIVLTILVWSITGTIPTRVGATGVLIRTGGVFDVIPTATGRITRIAVKPGDLVSEGEVVAELDQPELSEALRSVRARLAEGVERHLTLTRHLAREDSLREELVLREREVLDRSIRAAHEEAAWLESKLVGQRDLLEDGLIRRDELLTTEQRRASLEIRIEQLEGELQQLLLSHHAGGGTMVRELIRSEHDVAALEREVTRLEAELHDRTRVTSLFTGRILEVMAEVGAQSRAGVALMRMDRADIPDQRLEAVIYIPGGAGKQVQPGMLVQVSPATVRREEHGYMIGEIASVSEYPATLEAMNRTLKNQSLVQALVGGVPPYEAFVRLTLDDASDDGYAWSSESPGVAIHSGTICTATITTHERRPIELVAPYLRKSLGV